MKKKEKIGIGIVTVLFLFGVHQYFVNTFIEDPKILIYENNLIFQGSNGWIMSYGENDISIARGIRAMQPFFWKNAHTDIESFESQSYSVKGLQIHTLGPDIWLAEIENTKVLIVGPEPNYEAAVKTNKTLKAQYWYIVGDSLPNNFPHPKAIIWSQNRKALKPIKEFAEENNLPLLETQVVGDIMIKVKDETMLISNK